MSGARWELSASAGRHSVMRCRLLVLTAVVTLTVLGSAPRAEACSCEVVTENEAFARAGAVFVGRTASRGSAREGAATPETVLWTFEVSEVYKGEVRRTQQVVSAADSAGCGVDLGLDRSYLVFTDEDPAGGAQVAAHLCGGTRSGSDGALSPLIATARDPLADERAPAPAPPRHASRLPALAGAAVALVIAGAVAVARRRR